MSENKKMYNCYVNYLHELYRTLCGGNIESLLVYSDAGAPIDDSYVYCTFVGYLNQIKAQINTDVFLQIKKSIDDNKFNSYNYKLKQLANTKIGGTLLDRLFLLAKMHVVFGYIFSKNQVVELRKTIDFIIDNLSKITRTGMSKDTVRKLWYKKNTQNITSKDREKYLFLALMVIPSMANIENKLSLKEINDLIVCGNLHEAENYNKKMFNYSPEEGPLKDLHKANRSFDKLVAFDLDGTLIKGIRYSWSLLWQAICMPKKYGTERKKKFENNEISYQEWCDADLKELKAGELTLDKVRAAVTRSGCTLTKNLHEAIKELKNNGCIVVIISGGVDCILNILLPDADKLFDEIFINKLSFSRKTGIIEKITPTKYDWDDKASGVCGKNICLNELRDKYDIEKTVFVGDDRNDFKAMSEAKMSILYHSYDPNDTTRGTGSRHMPDNIIIEQSNDLLKVSKRIIEWNFDDE